MKLHETRRYISIAMEQAHISHCKYVAYKKEAEAYESESLQKKSDIYRIRSEALKMYAAHLKKQIKTFEVRAVKKENSEGG